MPYEFNKVAGALASCDHQKSKLRTVAGAEGFWVAVLRVRQLKISSKSCFGLVLDFIGQLPVIDGIVRSTLDDPASLYHQLC